MTVTFVTVLTILVSTGWCSVVKTESEDIKPLLEHILQRLDEKEARISQLEHLVYNQQSTIQQQQTALDQQQHRILVLEQELTQHKHFIQHFNQQQQQEIHDAETHHDAQEDTSHEEQHSSIESYTESHPVIQERRKHGGIRQVQNENPVAFTATLSNHTHNLGADQHVVFDRVVTNIGDAYNEHGGIFIAPIDGIYVFSTALMSYQEHFSHFAILKNGQFIARLYHNGRNSSYDTTTSTVVLRLAKGDDVVISNLDADKSLNGNNYCVFTGFLLQEIYDDVAIVG